MSPTIIAALIAGVPALVAAVAALRGATLGKRNAYQLRPRNGTTLATTVELLYDLVKDHIADPNAHADRLSSAVERLADAAESGQG